ncbi:MAG: ATP-binding cassette domain-containing protein [Anaerolineales bacterium]|nr:ATP-binding cassette domain-containing protein [Anaerolineales bacterium]
MLEIDRLTFTYPHQEPIFQDFSWQAARGETWAVLGPSGCGKSTLLYLLAGLRFPTSGQVVVAGQVLDRPRPHTGLIIQEYGLLPWATVRQNAELGLRLRNFYGPDGKHAPVEFRAAASVNPWLERLGILPLADKYPGEISGGQRQRTAIARTLALEPDLLLMDEPFSSLDAPTREALQNLTLELQAEQEITLVVVTHSIEEAAVLGHHILLLGHPPNTQAEIIHNPLAVQANYRDSQTYLDLCRTLRRRMDPDSGRVIT